MSLPAIGEAYYTGYHFDELKLPNSRWGNSNLRIMVDHTAKGVYFVTAQKLGGGHHGRSSIAFEPAGGWHHIEQNFAWINGRTWTCKTPEDVAKAKRIIRAMAKFGAFPEAD